MSLLDSAIDWLKDAVNSAGDTVSGWSQEWQNYVDNFKAKAKTFVNEYLTLQKREDIAALDPTVKKEYDSLMSKGSYIFNTIKSIASKLDFAIDNLMNGNTNTLNGMGVLPLLPIAVLAGAIAAIVAWLSDAYVMNRKLDALEKLSIETGADPEKLANAISDKNSLINVGGTPFSSMLPLFIGGIVLYLFWPQIKGALSND